MKKRKPGIKYEKTGSKPVKTTYTEWKGVRYCGKWIKYQGTGSRVQAEAGKTFSRIINTWNIMPGAVKSGWSYHARGKPFTGYNLFFMANYNAMKYSGHLELARGNGINAPWNLSAAINAAGEILVLFNSPEDTFQVCLFVQNAAAPRDAVAVIISRFDVAGDVQPAVLGGFDPHGRYNVYAVACSEFADEPARVSGSVVCSVLK